MIVRSTVSRRARCVFCSLIPTQTSRSVTTRADLAIPRHNLLAEPITGPLNVKAQSKRAGRLPYSSPGSKAGLARYKLMQYWARTSGTFGSSMEPSYTPDTAIDNPPTANEVTLELLMASQTHMGHSTSLWNPMNSRYIFGVRQGIHVISLEATAAHLKRAARVVEGVAKRAGLVLFVGTRKGQRAPVTRAAQRTGGCHLFSRWTPGSITNGLQLLKNSVIKAVDPMDRKIPGFDEELKEKVSVLKPDLVVCFNPLENKVLLHECALHGIPTIGVIDTDADPTCVTYPIPANDDSLRSIDIIAGVLGKAGEKGKIARLEAAGNGRPLPYTSFDLNQISFSNDTEKADDEQKQATKREGRPRRRGRGENEILGELSFTNDAENEQ